MQNEGLVLQDAKEAMINWLATAVESSAGRSKMHRNVQHLPTDGFVLTLNSILLKLCDPFVDPTANKAWSKLDMRYVGIVVDTVYLCKVAWILLA